MTDSLPRSQQRLPDGDEGDLSGWDSEASPPPDDAERDPAAEETEQAPAAQDAGERRTGQPGLPERPRGPAEGGD